MTTHPEKVTIESNDFLKLLFLKDIWVSHI